MLPFSSLPSSSSFAGQYDDADCIIRVLSAVLTQLIDVNHKSNNRQHFVTKFQSSYAPNISIQAYLERINKYAKCSPNCFVVALIYIDRLIEMKNIVLTSLNVHRILITSILLSTKVFDDEFYKNAYYAKLGGVSTSEMNTLEVEFLSLVNFNLFVSTETFEKYQQELQSFQIIIPSPTLPVSSSSLSSATTPTTLDKTNHLQKKFPGADSGPHLTVPNERIGDPNSISPLRPFDVSNVTLRSLLFNPHTPHTMLAAEDPSFASSAWSSSLPTNTLPVFPSSIVTAHDSPRSLTSYRSSDPSPTLSSTGASQKPESLYPESRAYAHQPSYSNSSGEYVATHPIVVAPLAPPFPRSTHPCNFTKCNPAPAVLPTQQKTHPRVYHHPPPSYSSRYPSQHAYEGNGSGSGHFQHYDSSGNGYHPSQVQASSSSFPPQHPPYHPPNSCGYFPPQNTQPFCPTPNQNYGPSQMQYSAGVVYPPPPQQMQYMGGTGYYYQPIPSPHMVPGSRCLAPSTTPNSVADIFGGPSGGKVETPFRQSQQQHQSCGSSTLKYEDQHQYYLQRSNSSLHPSAANGGSYSLGVGLQHPYYAWSEQQDRTGCSTGAAGLHFQHPSLVPAGMVPSLDVNSYPATTLFYPVPLRTVS